MFDIRTVPQSEEQDVAQTLTLSFAADPSFRYWFPRASDHLKWFAPFAMAMGHRGFAHDTVTATEDFEAVAMWLPPGVEPDYERVSTLDMPGTEESAAISAEVQGQMAHYHPKEPHWYLWMIGVDPRCQGKGYGSALLKHMLERCDREHAVAYLESSSPKNVPLYERHGFETIGIIQVRDVPPITPMIRRAR
ncbi:MAG TPA: GNAT family N-acetyltransferase [Rhizomicrobium sp.]|jgi:ribosomal protein S18 acetylase RimI-like enzyme